MQPVHKLSIKCSTYLCPLVGLRIVRLDGVQIRLAVISTHRVQPVAQQANAHGVPGNAEGGHRGPRVCLWVIPVNAMFDETAELDWTLLSGQSKSPKVNSNSISPKWFGLFNHRRVKVITGESFSAVSQRETQYTDLFIYYFYDLLCESAEWWNCSWKMMFSLFSVVERYLLGKLNNHVSSLPQITENAFRLQ